MATVQDGHEVINIIKDAGFAQDIARHNLRNYKGPKVPATSLELTAPLPVLAHPGGQQIVPTSQEHIVDGPSITVITNPKLFTERPLPNKIRTLTSPPTKSVISPKALTQPQIIDSSLQQLQVASRQYVESDDDVNDDCLVDVDEDSLDSDWRDGALCDECGAQFASQEELEKHERSHLGEVNYVCDQCGQEFGTKTSFEDHIKLHAIGKRFECYACHKRFDYRDNLIFHMRIHGEMKPYQCHVCYKMFKNESVLDTHRKKHLAYDPNFLSHVVLPDVEVPLFKCDACPKCFTNKNRLENHKVIHIHHERGPKLLGKKNPETVNKITPESPQARVSEYTPPSYSCPKCKKLYSREFHYERHVAVCVDTVENSLFENTVNCAFCKKNYSVPKQAKDGGSQSMKFICEPCCTFLAQKSEFSGFKPRLENRFICNKCDKCFASEDQLRNHLDSHLSEKIIKCYMCNKCFKDEKSFKVHKESHYLENWEPALNLAHAQSKDSKNSKNMQTHRNDKDSQKSASKVRNSSSESLDSKRAKTSNCKSGNKSKISKSSKESLKRNNKKELPGTSEKSGQKRRSSSSRKIKESHTPQKRGKLHTTDIGRESNDLSGDISDPNSDVDVGETYYELPFEEEEEFPNVKVFIKQEKDDFHEAEYIMENCTVFNSAMSGESRGAAFTIPNEILKKEDSDDDEMGKISIKEEKLSDDEMTFKEEDDEFDFLGFPVKEEKLDKKDIMRDEFEFTSFGDPVEKEDALHI